MNLGTLATKVSWHNYTQEAPMDTARRKQDELLFAKQELRKKIAKLSLWPNFWPGVESLLKEKGINQETAREFVNFLAQELAEEISSEPE